MRKNPVFAGIIIGLIAVLIIAVGCQKTTQQASSNGSSTSTTGKNPHPSGAINLADFPKLNDKSIIDDAKKVQQSVKSFKVITHLTARKNAKTVGDKDFEVTYISPDKTYAFGDDNVTGKRQEIYQIGDEEIKSFDGKKWTRTNKAFPDYAYIPSSINKMFDQGTNYHLVSKNRPEGVSKSCTVIIGERPSTVYKGETEQFSVWIDNASKYIVRLELLNDENKPVGTFTEEFFRFSNFNDPSLKIGLPAEAQATK